MALAMLAVLVLTLHLPRIILALIVQQLLDIVINS
jgi:hypothetical protein